MKTDWMTQGKCRELEWEMFFPHGSSGLSAARKICAECPVSEDCLEYALKNHIDHGVWGGCSERERGRILRRDSGKTVQVG
jgi:WhiB family transcriptional regulator, redox-sensing transcriptional regulator